MYEGAAFSDARAGVPQDAEEKVVTQFAVPKSAHGAKVSTLAHFVEICMEIRMFIL
ncbi:MULTISPECIES: hypothetical protein [unclassified Pantoea]|uniref:hypothetical protein n=1 Tax=unclassified Pantoea TaxID=2630326 RepID=UPI00301DF580